MEVRNIVMLSAVTYSFSPPLHLSLSFRPVFPSIAIFPVIIVLVWESLFTCALICLFCSGCPAFYVQFPPSYIDMAFCILYRITPPFDLSFYLNISISYCLSLSPHSLIPFPSSPSFSMRKYYLPRLRSLVIILSAR